jgi:phosphate uptake regulator
MERKSGAAMARLSVEIESGSGTRTDGSRRLQRMGAVTMGVSLPREWVGRHGLGVGSPVFLEPLADGSILVRDRTREEAPRTAEIRVRTDRPREHLFRRLVAAYLDGAQEFQVVEPGGLSSASLSVARTFVRRTIQPEIVSEDGERLHLRDVSRGSELDVAPLLKRMHQIVQRLHEEAAASFGGGLRGPADNWPARDDEVDRHAWLIERILALRAGAPGGGLASAFGAIPQLFVIVRSLERVADHAVQIAEHGAR